MALKPTFLPSLMNQDKAFLKFCNGRLPLVATSVDSVPSSKTNIFQSKLYTLIYCRHFRTYSRCAMFDWSDTVFRRRNVTRRRISNSVLQPRYWGSEADSPEICRLGRLQVMRSRVPLTFSCQRTIVLAGKPARLPRGWNMIFISRNMIFVLYDHVFWLLPIVQSN